MVVSHQELIAAIAKKRLVHYRIDRHLIPFEPHLYGRTSAGRDVVLGYGVASRDNFSVPGTWKTLTIDSIEDVDMKTQFSVALEIPPEYLAPIAKIYQRAK